MKIQGKTRFNFQVFSSKFAALILCSVIDSCNLPEDILALFSYFWLSSS